MVKYLIFGLMLSSPALAMDCNPAQSNAANTFIRKIASAQMPAAANSSTAETNTERRGCCSHHGGVCGCSSGRAKCCDGQLSPTCGC